MRKIVYFDENSATDYLTILNGDTLLISDSEEERVGNMNKKDLEDKYLIKILTLLKENASITTTEMAKQLSVNRRTIQRGLEVLKGRGIVERKAARDTAIDGPQSCEGHRNQTAPEGRTDR